MRTNISTYRNSNILLWLLISTLLTGCAVFTKDATDESMLWGEYERNKEYVLERDLFLIYEGNSKAYLIPEYSYRGRCLGRHRLAPESIDQYEKDPENNSTVVVDSLRFDFNVIGIVRKGTKLEVTKIIKRKGWTFMTGRFEDIVPYATILTGPYKATVADISDISIYYPDINNKTYIFRPEPGVISP